MEQSTRQALRKIREESNSAYDETRKVIKLLSNVELEEFLDSIEEELLLDEARLEAVKDEIMERRESLK